MGLLSFLKPNHFGLCFVRNPSLPFSPCSREGFPPGQLPKASSSYAALPCSSCTCLFSSREGGSGCRQHLSLGSGQTTQEGWAGKHLARQSGRVGRRVAGRGGHSMGLRGLRFPLFQEPIPLSAWFSGRLSGMLSPPTPQAHPHSAQPMTVQPSLSFII